MQNHFAITLVVIGPKTRISRAQEGWKERRRNINRRNTSKERRGEDTTNKHGGRVERKADLPLYEGTNSGSGIRKYGFRFPSPGFIAVHEVASGSKATLTISPRSVRPRFHSTQFRLAANGFSWKSAEGNLDRSIRPIFYPPATWSANFRRGDDGGSIDRFGGELGFEWNFMGKKIDRSRDSRNFIGCRRENARWWRGIVLEEMSTAPDIWLVCPSSSRCLVEGTRRTCPRIRYFLVFSWRKSSIGRSIWFSAISDYK